jgi:hypothetical protein
MKNAAVAGDANHTYLYVSVESAVAVHGAGVRFLRFSGTDDASVAVCGADRPGTQLILIPD